MRITDCVFQVLQCKSQDIINALDLVSTAKCNLQKLRQDGWDAFIGDVTSFCISNKIDMPDMSAHYKEGTGLVNKMIISQLNIIIVLIYLML